MMNARSTAHERTDDTYCTVSQAAAMLGVSRVSIWRWIRDGHLPAVRMGQRITRIRQDDLDRVRVEMQSAGSRSWFVRQHQEPHADGVDVADRASLPDSGPAPDHTVQFYETDTFLLDAVSEFIGSALRAGDAGIVVATKPHRDGLARRLRAAGLDLEAAVSDDRYIALDAPELLSRFMDEGMPDSDRFRAETARVVSRAARDGRGVKIFGEMVSLLVAAENYAAAMRLESLWNEFQHDETFSLLCAYQVGRLGKDALTGLIGDICAAHTRVIPAESVASLPTERERSRAVVTLQQQARVLQSQVAERERTVTELRFALETVQDTLRRTIYTQRQRDAMA